jgi:hypothetical protein
MTRNIPHFHRQVFRGLVIVAAGLTLSGTPAAQTTPPSWPIAEAPGELRAVVSRADLIVVSMHDAVLRELTDALSRGGPASAIGFCHLDATFLSQRIGKEEGIAAGRTSDRLRNPTNAPRPWAAPLVTANAGRQAKGVDGFVVDLGDHVGVLRPIAERPMCAGCDGPADKLSAGVLPVLADRYPLDRAVASETGRSEGGSGSRCQSTGRDAARGGCRCESADPSNG